MRLWWYFGEAALLVFKVSKEEWAAKFDAVALRTACAMTNHLERSPGRCTPEQMQRLYQQALACTDLKAADQKLGLWKQRSKDVEDCVKKLSWADSDTKGAFVRAKEQTSQELRLAVTVRKIMEIRQTEVTKCLQTDVDIVEVDE